MVKRALTLLTSILFALPLLMPFNIYADTLPQSEIVGVTYNKIDQDVTYVNSSGTYTYIYEVEVLLKNKYVGVVDGTLSYSYAENPQSQTVTTSKRTYVNGDSFKLNVSIIQFGSSYSGSSPMYSASFLVNAQNTNVTKYEDLTSIDSIVSILQDIYTNSGDIENLSTNQLSELEKIVQNTSLANQYLDTISKLREYNFPLESFGAVSYMFNKYEIIDYVQYGSWSYPLFNVPANSVIGNIYYYSGNYSLERIFICLGKFHANQSPFTFENGTSLGYDELFYNQTYGLWSWRFIGLSSGSGFTNIITTRNLHLCPIYLNLRSNKKLSTDFALRFNLSNQLLDDLHLIANGTTASQSAADSSQSANEQLQTDSNALFQQENGFKSDMQSAMQNVNNTFRLSDMGTKFVSSAQWVRTQYEQLTNNTPFASLITFSLITGLALILLGKVYK